MAIKKTRLVIELDSDSLKELRKVLFKRDLVPQQFLAYIIEMSAMHDDRLINLMDDAVTYKKTHSGKKRENKQSDAEMLYKLIEEKLKEKNSKRE